MKPIHYSTSLRALNQYVKDYNAGHELTIKASMLHTAEEIIKIYGVFLAKAGRIAPLIENDLPPLRTNNVQLAKRTHCSSRTIQRHIRRLETSGIITNKVFHGSNSSYELFLNPDILFITPKKPVEKTKMANPPSPQEPFINRHIEKILRTKCPHTDSGNKGYNNVIMDVENSEKRCSGTGRNALRDSGNSGGNILCGNTGKKSAEKNIEGAGKKVQQRRAEVDTTLARESSESRRTSLAFYARMLWSLMFNVLYRDTYLSESQQKIGQEHLMAWFEPVRTSRLSAVHQVYVERVELVRKYIEKDPENRFVQLPDRYLDPTNPHGFAGTRAWHEKHRLQQARTREKLIAHAQIRRFLNNAQKPSHRQRPPLQLYRECEQRVGKLNNPALMDQFHAAVLNNAHF